MSGAGGAPTPTAGAKAAPDPALLADLHARCFTTPRPWSAEEIAGLLGTPGVFLKGDATGFVMGRVILDESELLTLAVDPDLRGQGRGRALLRGFVEASSARGATRAFLEVAADNIVALSLYEGDGWQRTGLRRGYYRPHATGTPPPGAPGTAARGAPIDAVVMARAL
ncbi:hypothetical protein BV394_11255 [Brevirhabdus pacifica]|uniref:Uncharacterized protein n=2 Tax=Brevirhabdus pacifica TaxID=1267768 RepID=A0A1U7DJS2_9RHOB|nr:GNAT family N-acetyltransferase [Brevirhabdus pacifica]APX90232.1 hypothetical protein BV394_11255 [Brevirhabdus pacifica]PJJ80669.1 ribosomal-protein-alanine N-acetyltransferase [Brevirhabdus pacifica]